MRNKYIPIARNVLFYEEKHDCCDDVVVCKKAVTSTAFFINRRGMVPEKIVEGEDVTVSIFEIAANPCTRLKNLKKIKKTDILNSAINGIKKTEDNEFMNLLNSSTRKSQTIAIDEREFNEKALLKAISFIEAHELEVENIIIHQTHIPLFKTLESKRWKECSKKEFKETAKLGTYDGINVWVTIKQQLNNIHITGDKETLGVFIETQPITPYDCLDIKNLRDGYVVYEEVGVAILNDYAVAKIEFLDINTKEI